MEDIEYLLDRIAFLEERLAHIESTLMPKGNTSQENLLELYKKIQDAKKITTAAIHVEDTIPRSFTSTSVDESQKKLLKNFKEYYTTHQKLLKNFKEYYTTHLRGDL